MAGLAGRAARRVFARLAAQPHRRFIKTHTPLDGVPLDPRAHYVVVARHPLDMAVSLYHQSANLDRARIAELTGQPDPGRATPAAACRAGVVAELGRPGGGPPRRAGFAARGADAPR